tara:strand:+ start:6820 stop:6936 length:117 start_codon:yes stop_codon:yes gene_type:complete
MSKQKVQYSTGPGKRWEGEAPDTRKKRDTGKKAKKAKK